MSQRAVVIMSVVALCCLTLAATTLVIRSQAQDRAPAAEETSASNPYYGPDHEPGNEFTLGSYLAMAGVVGVSGGCVALSLWAQRRRRRGEEATSYNAQGADAGVDLGGW